MVKKGRSNFRLEFNLDYINTELVVECEPAEPDGYLTYLILTL